MASTADLVTDSVADLSNQNGDSKQKSFNDLPFKEKLKFIQTAITIEPVIALYLLATVFCIPAVTVLPLEMACRANAGFNDSVCQSIIEGTHEEMGFVNHSSEVQQYVSDMSSWCTPVQNIVPVILLLFLGTFSDKHKLRKPFILIPIFGESISALCCILCKLNVYTWPVEIEGVAQYIIPSLFGSYNLLVMAAFSYMIDISTPDMRVIRIALLQVVLSICTTFGWLLSGLFYDLTGDIPSLALGLVLYVVAFVYGLFTVKEPKQHTKESFGTLIADAFNPQHVIETFKLFTKSRGAKLFNIIFIMFISFLNVIILGEGNVFFLFVNFAYGWTTSINTYYSAASTIIGAIGLAVGIPLLSKVFMLNDLLIIAVSFFDKIISNIISVLVRTTCGMYMALVAGVISGINGAAIRSQSARYVSEEDMGKTQSLLAVVEAIGGAIAVEIYHQGVYTHTRDKFPQAFFLVAVVVYAFGIPLLIAKHMQEKKNPPVTDPPAENGTEMQNTKI